MRSATANDLDDILVLEQQTANAAHWSRHQYEKLLAEGLILVAEESSAEKAAKLVGFLCARNTSPGKTGSEWEIENIVVTNEVLRRGVGTALLQNLIVRAQSESASRIMLEVRESNVAARRLYERNGFDQTGLRRSYYRDPDDDAVLYELRFDVNQRTK